MSSTYASYYGRKEASGPFALIELIPDSPEFDDKDLGNCSVEHGEVIYLAEQGNVGFVHYEHWKNGQLLRRLKYNDDYSWLSAAGEPEEWEALILFTPELLTKTLQSWDAEGHDEIKNIWERKRIQEGDRFPILGLVNLIGGLRKHWNLTETRP